MYAIKEPACSQNQAGSCYTGQYPWAAAGKGIALNRRLIEAPKNCIEYVVTHEFCHLVYPNHSKQFYALLQVMLPDWRESKDLLENVLYCNKSELSKRKAGTDTQPGPAHFIGSVLSSAI
ncbi:MAG: M48 family metallopeptidase [Oscillospiraceae bacterium]|nr:M48 family metallopeptidase [Oscillospiraceae bacterium]